MILVFGNGWLGNRFADRFDALVSDADILDTERVAAVVMDKKPEAVVNAAGKCGTPNIDWCDKPENRKVTLYVNAFGPSVLFHVVDSVAGMLGRNIRFVHLSTGCLWRSGRDIDEERRPEPESWYARTKADGDARLPKDKVLIVRMRMPLDDRPNPRNLITKVAGYSTVLDEQNSVTVVGDMMDAVAKLLDKGCKGVYNVVNEGTVSAADVARAYAEVVDPSHRFETVDSDWLRRKGLVGSVRPSLTLSVAKLRAEGIAMPDVRRRLPELVTEYRRRMP